jgi:hypothetical protein
MPLDANWTPPTSWSVVEKEIFESLRKGDVFDKCTADERADPKGENIATAKHRAVTISGSFLSQIVRSYTDEFPRGVRLRGVAINGPVDIENVQINKILSLQRCYFDGPIIARHCKLLRFDLSGSVLEDGFDLRSSEIAGAVFLRWGFQSLTCTLMRDTTVKGPIECDGAVFKYDSLARIGNGDFRISAASESFSLSRSTASALFWQNMRERPEGIVNLRNCKIGSLRDNIKNVGDVSRDWPRQGNLRMSGLKYEDRTSSDPQALLAWIELQDASEVRYGSYQTVIKMLSDSGQETSANEIVVAKQRFTAEREQSKLTWALRKAYISLARAGVGTDRIALITLVAFLLSLAVVFAGERGNQFVPKSADVAKVFDNPKACPADWIKYGDGCIPTYYPAFNTIGYTIDSFVPGVSIGTSGDWRPREGLMTWLTAAIRVIGSLLIGLLLVCVSGIAKLSR